ncbi:Histidine--tRNA ligase [Afipia felis]|uniref:Histidine--tRNA ligase n=1 Tax=Afipia felis TaxID=1035 RepID=A0A090MPQ3_AFIFE|nr:MULTISPECIES: histidine--tRNA ligase [Afipia]EFI51187.1 histidyl-tRNA synthetase [Afipia sp. 1NLS2]CEG09326.1 Histidine--tRNA ligase [Afipia felis]
MSDKKSKKPQKLRARLPRGLVDRTPSEIAATRAMVEKIRAVYERYGFEPVETPAMEYTDALGKFLPDQDRPNEGVFSFQDDDEQWISLRYDLTAPLARYVAENFDTLPKPYRSYRHGYVYRNEKPGPGRFRQFMQFDADTVGSASPAADAEMCMMAADTMEALGIPRGSYVVKVNNRKVLDGIREKIGVTDDGQWLTVMRAIDKLDKFSEEDVHLLMTVGRKDPSGDFTKGAGLSGEHAEMILSRLRRNGSNNEETLNSIRGSAQENSIYQAGIAELEDIAKLSTSAGYRDDRIRIDPSVVRGLEYYTGPVYEVELLLETRDDKGRPVRFGSVGGGGRYDGLVSRFRGEPVPATGFSIGVSRLQAALTLLGKIDTRPEAGPVVVLVMDRNEIAQYQKFVTTLRNSPVDPSRPDGPRIRAEMYLGNPKNNLGVQFKYADRRNSPCAIIQGGDEKAKGIVQIKDLILGAQVGGESADREAFLQKQQHEAQFAVNESELVEGVRKVLARHNVSWK